MNPPMHDALRVVGRRGPGPVLGGADVGAVLRQRGVHYHQLAPANGKLEVKYILKLEQINW